MAGPARPSGVEEPVQDIPVRGLGAGRRAWLGLWLGLTNLSWFSQPPGEGARRGRGVIGFGDGTHDDYPGGPGSEGVIEPGEGDAADREPGTSRALSCCMGQQPKSGSRASRLGRCCPYRPGAEIVDARFGGCRVGLGGSVSAASDQRVRAQDAPRGRHRQIVLAQVEHVGAGCEGHVGAVVDCQQATVPSACVSEHLQKFEFLACFESFLAQLHDVHPGAEDRVEELGQVTG
jgi:hypothetical protein